MSALTALSKLGPANLRTVLLGCAMAFAAPALQAQETFPNRPVRIIVPYGAGGGTDITARQISERLTAQTGQAFIVDNRAGAASQIGTEAVARSPADGYTLLFSSSSSLTLLPALDAKARFDVLRDFDAVAIASKVPLVLVVPASLGVKDLAGLRALLKANPGKHSYASAGIGTGSHVAPAVLLQMTGATGVVHVPYKSAGAASLEVIAGRNTMMFDAVFQQLQNIRSGRVIALAVTDTARVASLPDVPTMSEAGMPEFMKLTWAPWQGFLAPKGTPRPILERLNQEIGRALRDPGLMKTFAATEVTPMGRPLAETQAFVEKEVKEWGALIKTVGITVD